jgi:two-component system response regulator YesN
MYRSYFVDDEPLVLEELTANPLFAESGFEVVGSNTNPVAAVKQIMRLYPDVVFADLVMPELSGVDLMARLKDNEVECEYVIISAFPEFVESRRFFLLGGFDYILKPLSNHGLQYLLNRLSAKLAGKRTYDDIPKETASLPLNMIIADVRANPFGNHTLESVSARYHLCPTHVCRLFATHMDTTFVTFLNGLRMEEVGKRLKETDKGVREISRICGYKDFFYFCRVFRKHHACTPTEFRNRET